MTREELRKAHEDLLKKEYPSNKWRVELIDDQVSKGHYFIKVYCFDRLIQDNWHARSNVTIMSAAWWMQSLLPHIIGII